MVEGQGAFGRESALLKPLAQVTTPAMANGIEQLECYLVGGAVRDRLLGRPVGDRDWVVIGATVQQMRQLGFTQVGRDFPVFLHPDTHEEYALARTERKLGAGHTGFAVHAAPDVTLEQDLERRDLTINAIAEAADGSIIDPFGGVADLQARLLRHVSDAFSEDPLRVLRVARLAAQLQGFQVADATRDLMKRMVAAGELKTLSAERVWQEFEKALGAAVPERFFQVLASCDGLRDWFAELQDKAPRFLCHAVRGRFAELPLTDAQFTALAERLKAPSVYLQAARDALQFGPVIARWWTTDAGQLTDVLVALKAFHSNTRLRWLLDWLQETGHGRVAGAELIELVARMRTVRPADPDLQGSAYGAALRRARIDWLAGQRVR